MAAFGAGLARESASAAGLPLPAVLAGTTVKVRDRNGSDRAAPLFYVSPGQVNFLLPPATALGPAVITVVNAEGRSFASEVEVTEVAPGLFSFSGTGKGPAAASLLRIKADGSRSEELATGPIQLGALGESVYLSLFGTGIRNRAPWTKVRVRIGEEQLEPTYAGPQAEFPGLDQINVLLPHTLKDRGNVGVAVVLDGKTSNPVQISIR